VATLASTVCELGDTPDVEVGKPFRLLQDATVERCERCGAREQLSVARFEAWRLQAVRTLCDFCANVLFETFIETDQIYAERAAHDGALALIR
jgi:hypothetical protein